MSLAQTRPAVALADPAETGRLGIMQLKRLWSRAMAARSGRPVRSDMHDKHLDEVVIHGFGLEQAVEYLYREGPDFDAFEAWVERTSGGIDPLRTARINAAVADEPPPEEVRRWLAEVEASPPVLDADDLACWDEHGYVVVRDAVAGQAREAAVQALCERVGANLEDPDTWYLPNDHTIMVQYFQHPAFEANRRSPRIHKAFAQLWGHADLWCTTDRVGFNPPERPGFKFPARICIGT